MAVRFIEQEVTAILLEAKRLSVGSGKDANAPRPFSAG